MPQWWWGELVATLTMTLRQPPLQLQALGVISTFVLLLQEDQLARGLPQLVLMLLPCLLTHPGKVVRILESLILRPDHEQPTDALQRALGELTFVPRHPALHRVHAAIQRYTPPPSLRQALQTCSRGVAHEARAVRAMAVRQLLDKLQGTEPAPLPANGHPSQDLDGFSVILSPQRRGAPASQPEAEAAAPPTPIARGRHARRARHDPELCALLHSAEPADQALVSELLHQLLLCVHESHNASSGSALSSVTRSSAGRADASSLEASRHEANRHDVAAEEELVRTAELALEALGELGAHDPARLGAAPARTAAASGKPTGKPAGVGGAVSLNDARLSDEAMAQLLLEGPLVRMLRSAGEGHVPAAGYAAMVLLQRVCKCTIDTPAHLPLRRAYEEARTKGHPAPDGYHRLSSDQRLAVTVWCRLSEGARGTITPYLRCLICPDLA